MKAVSRTDLELFFSDVLKPDSFSDYCPNGLQVQGKSEIKKLVTGVTASANLIQSAAAAGADAILVHHGYFWRGEDPRLIGMKGERVARLFEHQLSLFGFHLPLDAHEEFGNNVQLARQMDWTVNGRSDENDLVFHGALKSALSADQLATEMKSRLGQQPVVVGNSDKPIKRIAWCTGGAQDYLDVAIALNVDAYVSGEISERTTHTARECGITYFAAGHHATERYGVQALGAAVAKQFGIEHEFIDDPNPA
jgi:dinuclear metal center YbgI/SA1388 family protein